MDAQRFDRMARSLSAGTSRRRLMRGLVAGMVCGTVSARGVRQVLAAKSPAFSHTCQANCAHACTLEKKGLTSDDGTAGGSIPPEFKAVVGGLQRNECVRVCLARLC